MKKLLIYCFLFFLPTQLIAQNFKLMRYNENYSGLKDSVQTFYNRIKYMPLSKSGSVYLSFGGEARQELDYSVNEDWGEIGLGEDLYLLQRYAIHADLNLGNRIRFFVQLRSGLEDGRNNGPRGTDEDKLNIQNLFVDFLPYVTPSAKLTLRLGRQEIQYGSGRLIDVREGTNLRLFFDGVKLAYESPRLNIDTFVLANAQVNTGAFDNELIRSGSLWGFYGTYSFKQAGDLDVYYLGINRDDVMFDEGVADESRHSVGTRLSRNEGGFVYNFELIYQFGTFGVDKISAYGISSEIGYQFNHLKGSPTIKLKSDYISGDKNRDDGKLGTPNPLFPNGGYFGMNPQVGPANLIALHPNFAWNPYSKISLKLNVVLNWRQSTEDGIYRANGSLRLPSSDSDKRYIGTAFITTLSWNICDFLKYSLGVQYFKTGSFIKEVVPEHKNGFFIGSIVGIKF